MKKVLLIAAVALCAMGCCKKADKACEGNCCAEEAAVEVVEEAEEVVEVAEVADSAAVEVVEEVAEVAE